MVGKKGGKEKKREKGDCREMRGNDHVTENRERMGGIENDYCYIIGIILGENVV